MRFNIEKRFEINLISRLTTPASVDITNMAAFVYRSYSINQRTIFILNLHNDAFLYFRYQLCRTKHLNDKHYGAFKYSNSSLLNHKSE